MRKLKATMKDIGLSHAIVIGVPYCGLQYLLRYKSPIAYASGIYGWNCDLYSLSDTIGIATGYRVPKNAKEFPLERIQYYDKLAMETNSVDEVNHLLSLFTEEVNQYFLEN